MKENEILDESEGEEVESEHQKHYHNIDKQLKNIRHQKVYQNVDKQSKKDLQNSY